MANHAQLTKLAIIRNQSGKTRDEWFAWLATELGGRYTSNRELTEQQASHLLDVCEAGTMG